MPNINDIAGAFASGLSGTQFNTAALSTTTASVGQLAGSAVVVMQNTGNNPGTYTTRTAAQMIADHNLQIGQTWLLILGNNQGTGTLTLAGGSGVTVSGTATCGTQVARLVVCTVVSASAITMVGTAFSFTCAA